MTPDFDAIFPDGISDETAAVLTQLLHQLVCACESRYLPQLQRYQRGQLNLYDPEAPWKKPPRKRT